MVRSQGSVTVAKSSTATWTLTFSGLTGQVKAAELRYPGSGTVSVIRLCAPCANGAKLVTTFPSRAVAQAVVKQALAGKADVVLKTKRNRAGEVRGVVKAKAALCPLASPEEEFDSSSGRRGARVGPAGAAQPVTRNVVVARDTQRPKPALAK